MSAQFYPGKRLSFDGDLCTVRYIGQVRGTKGDWLGVEWDDPTRGKHDGSHGGVRYFECIRKHPTAGSFVRPNRPSDAPNSFVEALHKKYASEALETPVEVPDLDIRVFGKAPDGVSVDARGKVIKFSGKVAEEVGFDKIRKRFADLQELRVVILDGMCMARPLSALLERVEAPSTPDKLTDIKDTSPKIQELDLSRNLFEEWRELASICIQLEDLRTLRVDGTRLRDIQLDPCLSPAFTKVTTLGLEDTLLNWKELVTVSSYFPKLTTFNASNNAFSKLSGALLPSTITELILEKNDFSSLSDLVPLTKLPNLQRLRLKNNSISSVFEPDSSESPLFSSSLFEVDLSYNSISSWAFIDALPTVFPGLTDVRVSNNPLYTDLRAVDDKPLSADDGYMLTIARLGNLKSLNYSAISAKERLNAEAWYLSQIAAELAANPESKEREIIAKHRRYVELCAEYGDPIIRRAEGDAAAIKPNSLAARLIKFTFYAGDSVKAHLSGETESEFSVELPRGFTVYSTLGVVGKKLDLPPLKLRLFWETGDWVPVEEVLDRGLEDVGEWDSEEDEDGTGKQEEKTVREVEWVAGTKMVGTWVEGIEARVRVEMVE